MKIYLARLFRLFFGIILYAFGIVLSVKGDIGMSPWATFHAGISNVTPLTMGQATIIIGMLILVIDHLMGIKIGFGTVVNVLGIGTIVDFIMASDIIPTMTTLTSSIIMVIISMFVIAFATYFYMGAAFGAGPRDGLMVGLVKKTNKEVGVIRSSMEITVLFIGFMLGAKVGLGTVILGIFIGPVVHWVFKIMKFDVKEIKHQYLQLKYQS